MDLIKNYTLFANAQKVNFKLNSGDWISRYAIDNVTLKHESVQETYVFIPEYNKKLTKRLAEYGYKTNGMGKGLTLMRRIKKLLQETDTTKADWSHVVYPTDNGLDVWMLCLFYDSFKKIVDGQIVLFRMVEKTKQVEVIRYQDCVIEHKKVKVDNDIYYTPAKRKGGGRYHSFNKKDGWKPFVWKLEMSKEENRGWKLGKLRKDATLEENTEHNNKVVDVVNRQIDEVTRLRQEIEALKAQLKAA
ncbi:hypothetical protein CGJ43_00095 [Vibrio parahaemolyticus]|nr:hypothetical protein CGJ43_00095 [Vibrio parahaemolyticus]